MLVKSLPSFERPREKALKSGVKTLSNTELLALILRTGKEERSALDLAEEVLSECEDGLFSMGTFVIDDIMKIDGIGPGKASAVMAAVELGKRIAASRQSDKPVINDSEEVADMFMEDLRYERKEHFKTVTVNTRGEVMSVENVSTGDISRTLVHPREVFTGAIKKGAYGVILVHNHPSGDPDPSQEDIITTKRLIEGGELLGIKVLDHVIIGDGKYSSLRALDFMN